MHDDAQVVERREYRVEREDDGEPRVARVEDGLDDEELRDEADGRRDPRERDEEDREGERTERLAAREAVELVERRAARALEVDVEEAGERAEVHDSVREYVEEHGGAGGGTRGRGRDGREDVPPMGEAPAPQHPVRVRLVYPHDVGGGD